MDKLSGKSLVATVISAVLSLSLRQKVSIMVCQEYRFFEKMTFFDSITLLHSVHLYLWGFYRETADSEQLDWKFSENRLTSLRKTVPEDLFFFPKCLLDSVRQGFTNN